MIVGEETEKGKGKGEWRRKRETMYHIEGRNIAQTSVSSTTLLCPFS